MLTALGGRERTAEEYRLLLDEAGIRISRVIATDSPMSIIEAVPNRKGPGQSRESNYGESK